MAASNGHAAVVEVLIASSADLAAADTHGETPLRTAASIGNADVQQVLVDGGAALVAADENGTKPLHTAGASNHYAAFLQELIVRGADDEAKDEYGTTPSPTAAASNAHVTLEKMLRSTGPVCAVVTAAMGKLSFHPTPPLSPRGKQLQAKKTGRARATNGGSGATAPRACRDGCHDWQ